MLVLDDEGFREHSPPPWKEMNVPPPPCYLFGMPERIASNFCDVGEAVVGKVLGAVLFPPPPMP